QRVQCSRIAVTVRRGTQYVERLQQVLDVMCDLGAGLMQRVHVRLFPEGPLPQLRDVELREQLPEEVEMPHQRRAGTHLAVEMNAELIAFVVDAVIGLRAEVAGGDRRFPTASHDPRQPGQILAGAVEKALRIRLRTRQRRKKAQPLFERQTDGKQIAREK